MAPIASLQAIVVEMEATNDMFSAFLSKRTGELVTVTEEELAAAEAEDDLSEYPGWQQDQIRVAREIQESDGYLALPDKFDIDDYRITERCCYSVEDDRVCDELCSLIRGSGAFRRLKDAIHRHGIADEWYDFYREAPERIAIDWLELHGIEYTRDSG